MKSLGLLIITTYLAIANSELKYNSAPVVTNCPLLPVDNYSQTFLFDMDEQGHSELKTCILKNSLSGKSVVLLNMFGAKKAIQSIKSNVTKAFIKTNDNPNVIVMTEYLTPKMVDSIWLFFIRSHWSLLYIVVTGDNKFNCRHGKMDNNDYILLENILNTLWHRFKIMRVGVIFPLACKQKMIIFNGKRPTTRILYDRSIKLINATKYNDLSVAVKKSGYKLADGYPMLGNIFLRYPTAIKECKNIHYYVHFNWSLTLGYCGLDAMVMHDILSHLKFNLIVPEGVTCNNYGYALPENISGSLGCIIRKELDISFNSRFMTLYSDEHIYYLHYVTTDTLCALIKKPDVVPLWEGVFNLFSPSLWILITTVVVAIGGIMWATAMIYKSITGKETMIFWRYVQNSVITTIFGFAPTKSKTFLIIRSSCLAGSILFMAIYQGHMSRVYTTVSHFPQLKTLKELYSSGATLYTSSSMREFMRQLQDPDNKLQAEFFDRADSITENRLGMIAHQCHACATTVDRKSDATIGILQRYSDSRGYPLIDILDECFYTYYLSCIARSGFPFFEDVKKFTQRLNEAGLPAMYYKWTQQSLGNTNSPKNDREHRSFSKIKLEDQSVAFGILFAGTIVSIIVFAAELWQGGRHNFKLNKRKSIAENSQ